MQEPLERLEILENLCMMNRVQQLVLGFCFFAFAKAYTQEPPQKLLSKETAIEQMLTNNFGIQIANNQVAVAENNKSILNAGFCRV